MGFSALQRAEIAEMLRGGTGIAGSASFSALQRAEIAEMLLLRKQITSASCFSALQRAEIAEINEQFVVRTPALVFQCSSTSRNC